MSTMNFKKRSVVAIAAVMAMAGTTASRAAQIADFSTGFEASGGTPGAVYTVNPINGQNGWTQDAPGASGNVVNAGNGQFGGGSGPFAGTNSLRITGANAGGASSDFYTTTISGNGPDGGTPFNPNSSPYGPIVNVSFAAQLATPNTGGRSGESTAAATATTPAARSGFGMDILSPSGSDIASIYLRPDNLTPGQSNVPLLEVTTTGNGSLHVVDTGAAQDTWGTYSLRLDFTTNTFFAIQGTKAYGPFPLGAGSTIGEIGLAVDNNGINTGYFDNLVVSAPEPTGIAMVGIGALILLAKRPKRLA